MAASSSPVVETIVYPRIKFGSDSVYELPEDTVAHYGKLVRVANTRHFILYKNANGQAVYIFVDRRHVREFTYNVPTSVDLAQMHASKVTMVQAHAVRPADAAPKTLFLVTSSTFDMTLQQALTTKSISGADALTKVFTALRTVNAAFIHNGLTLINVLLTDGDDEVCFSDFGKAMDASTAAQGKEFDVHVENGDLLVASCYHERWDRFQLLFQAMLSTRRQHAMDMLRRLQVEEGVEYVEYANATEGRVRMIFKPGERERAIVVTLTRAPETSKRYYNVTVERREEVVPAIELAYRGRTLHYEGRELTTRNIKLVSVLGKGKYGVVYAIDDGTDVAKVAKFFKADAASAREIEISKRVGNSKTERAVGPYVYHDFYVDLVVEEQARSSNAKYKKMAVLVMERMDTTLYDVLMNSDGRYVAEDKIAILERCVQMLTELHDVYGITHGDSHVGNIMIKFTGEHDVLVYLIDFGRAVYDVSSTVVRVDMIIFKERVTYLVRNEMKNSAVLRAQQRPLYEYLQRRGLVRIVSEWTY